MVAASDDRGSMVRDSVCPAPALLVGVLSFVSLVASGCGGGEPPVVPHAAVVAVPPAPDVPARPPLLESTGVDARLRAEWQRAGVTSTPAADDATWLRRLWIDVLGTIPPPEVVTRFLADASAGPAKRARAVDEVLASPLWADHWTSYWDDVLMGRVVRDVDVDRGAFRSFLHAAFARNAPWDEVVTALLTATGRSSSGGPKRQSEIDDGTAPPAEGVSGAVNFTLRFRDAPQDLAGTASRTLLGVQIQCAQCHDHKTEKWTQLDFQAFAAAFARTRPRNVDEGATMGAVRRVDLEDLPRPAPRFAKMADLAGIMKAAPAALDGTSLGDGTTVRVALARWVTSRDNPWFSRAFVNRMWGHFLGRGFVDPVDDMRPSNPPAAPAVFDALSADFVASGYDVKHLVRVIAGTEVYALTAAPSDAATRAADPDTKLWERFRVQPLGPDELVSSLAQATRLDGILRAAGRMDLAQVRFQVKQRYGFLFDVDEEMDAADFEGTLSQALALINGSVVATGASVLPGSALSDVVAQPGDEREKVRALYLRTLSRLPTASEADRWATYVADAGSHPPADPEPPAPAAKTKGPKGPRPAAKGERPRQPDSLAGLEGRAGAERTTARAHAYEDLLWVLLNSSEFAFNH